MRSGRARSIIPAVLRATDRRRERTVAVLGDGFAAGCIGPDTLAFRVERALRARTVEQLRALVADLPAPACDPTPAVRVSPPPDGPGPWIVGRCDTCRLIIDAETVSRVHAELRRCAGGWEVRDLGSTNGTWVNGWRVDRATLRRGDELYLGSVRVRLR